MYLCYNFYVYDLLARNCAKIRQEVNALDNSEICVLVVDDEADIRKIVRLLLQKKGC